MQQRASLLKCSTPTTVPGGPIPTIVQEVQPPLLYQEALHHTPAFAQSLALKEHVIKTVRSRLTVGVCFRTLSSLSSAYTNTMLCLHMAKLPPTNYRGICQEYGNV